MSFEKLSTYINTVAAIKLVDTEATTLYLLDALMLAGGLLLLLFARHRLRSLVSSFVGLRVKDPKKSYAIARLLNMMLGFALVLVALGFMGVELQSLLTIFAALGIGIGFGIQNLVNNAVSGVILLLEQPVRAGDIVEIDSNFGLVQEIGWRATRIINWDNVEILLPNSRLLEANVVNWTLSDPIARIGVPFGVAYGTDRVKLREVALEVARSNPLAVKKPEPVLVFKDYGDSSLNYMLSIWTTEPWMKNMILSQIRESLLDAFEAHDIHIPFPQRDVHLKDTTSELRPAAAGQPAQT